MNTQLIKTLSIIFLASVAITVSAECGNDFTLSPEISKISLKKHTSFFVDETHKLSISDLLSNKDKYKFQSFDGRSSSFGLSDKTHWLRFTVCNPHSYPLEWLLEAQSTLIDLMEIYEIENNTVINIKAVTRYTKFSEREIKYRRYIFSFAHQYHQVKNYYVRFKPDIRTLVDTTLMVSTPEIFDARVKNENIIWGIFYGGVIILFFYNLFIYTTVRDRAYLYYILYLASVTLGCAAISGHANEFLWGENIFLKEHSLILLTSAFIAFAGLFSRQFLNTAQTGSLNDKLLLAVIMFSSIILLGTLVGLFKYIAPIAWKVGYLPIIFFTVGIRVYRAGYKPAKFYVTSWAILAIGSIPIILVDAGLISYNMIAEAATPLSVWIEAAILSFALAARIKLLQQQREETESKLIQAQIEPHFLFNTLANISSLIKSNTDQAGQMLGQLDTYLRTSLARTRQEKTTLSQEITMVKAYLSIIQVRMGNRLEYTIDIPENLYTIALPPLLLQPLVENSIRHGLEPKAEGGKIAITGYKTDSKLILEVKDTGIGLSDNWLAGTGLSNVHTRVRVLYGKNAKLEVMEHIDGGVISRLTIPVH